MTDLSEIKPKPGEPDYDSFSQAELSMNETLLIGSAPLRKASVDLLLAYVNRADHQGKIMSGELSEDGPLRQLRKLPELTTAEIHTAAAVDQAEQLGEQTSPEKVRGEYEELRQQLEGAVVEVEKLRIALRGNLSETYLLLTEIQLLGSEDAKEAARLLFKDIEYFHDQKDEVVSKGLELRRAQLAEPGSTEVWQEKGFEGHFDRIVDWATSQLKDRMPGQRDRLTEAMRKDLKLTQMRRPTDQQG